jgi:hypothetical protein
MALSIAMVITYNAMEPYPVPKFQWKFYTTKVGKAVGSCGETEGQSITADSNNRPTSGTMVNPPWPAGIFRLDIEGETCMYKCDGTNPGRLFCPKKEIACHEDPKKRKADGLLECRSGGLFHPIIYYNF